MMVLEQSYVLVRQFLAVHLLESVSKNAAVESDEVLLWKLTDESRKVLLLDVGICVILAAGSCILSLAILDEEVKVVANLAVFAMPLAIEHE